MLTKLVTATFAGADTGALATSLATDPIPANIFLAMAIQHVISSSAGLSGTLKLQGSCDVGVDPGTGPSGVTGVTNWSDLDTPAFAVTGDGVNGWNVVNMGYRYLRVVWTRTGGTGTISVTANGKGG